MKRYILYFSIVIAAGLLVTNIYNSLIDAKSWAANVPASIQTARNYFQAVNPGDFYRVFSPVNQVLAFAALVVFWKRSNSLRNYLAIAFLLYVLAGVLTFAYFYPRNEILFRSSIPGNADQINTALTQWIQMNWVRSLMAATGLFFSFRGLDSLFKPGK